MMSIELKSSFKTQKKKDTGGKFYFKKRFGQNFISDKNFLSAVIRELNLLKSENILEIGAGAGALTEILCKNFKKVISFEIDKTLTEVLKNLQKNNKNLLIVFEDVLKISTEKIDEMFSKDFVMIANLPYYVTSAIIFKFLFESKYIKKMFVMVQKEVAVRFCAEKNSKDYGIPTVLLKTFSHCKILKNVSRKLFVPEPKVDSCILKIEIDKNKFGIKNIKNYANFVACCFKMKRKTLLNNLLKSDFKKEKIDDVFKVLGFLKTQRAEELDVNDFINLYNKINSTIN